VVDGKEYTIYNKKRPKQISSEEYEAIFEFFTIDPSEKAQHTMRMGFVDILNGKINPNSYKHETGQKEHVYWKELYHEARSVLGLRPEDLFEGLGVHQPGFDLEKTKLQLNVDATKQYIEGGKRLSSAKYEIYFPELVKPSLFDEEEPVADDEVIHLEGAGDIIRNEQGLFLLKYYKNNTETIRILEGKLTIEKACYDFKSNNKLLVTGYHMNRELRTYSINDLMAYLKDYMYYGTKGADAVKYYVHYMVDRVPKYELSTVLGFNSHWNLPCLEEEQRIQILTSTDMQKDAYDRAAGIVESYTEEEKENIRKLMNELVEKTQMKELKKAIIIGWNMAAPFRSVFIEELELFPVFCAYGNRGTGKSSVIEFFSTMFYDIYPSYQSSSLLFSLSRFEDTLTTSSFPVFVQEVKTFPENIINIVKEHCTGTSPFQRKKNARELDFNAEKTAPLIFDCNYLPKQMQDPAMNSKLVTLEFTDEDVIEMDPAWLELRNKLKEYKLFSILYDKTKNWTKKDLAKYIGKFSEEIITQIHKKKSDIERNNPRIIQQYAILAFGIELFNSLFGTKFNRKKILGLLLESRTIMSNSLLNDFYMFFKEALKFEPGSRNPNYLNHGVEKYNSNKYGEGWFFTSANKADFTRFTNYREDASSLDSLIQNLRDALPEKQKYLIQKHNSGRLRGLFVHEDFVKELQEEMEGFTKVDRS